MDSAPSGEQFTITSGDDIAVAVELGRDLRSYIPAGASCSNGFGEMR